MPWVAIRLQVDAPRADTLSDALLELGAQSVTIEDADPASGREQPIYAESAAAPRGFWPHNCLTVLLAPRADPQALLGAAAQAAGLDAMPDYEVAQVDEDDWVHRARSQFDTQRIGERLWIVPSWCRAPHAEDAIVIRLDPGLAFGTGSHPTTRLVLAWLERALRGTSGKRAAQRPRVLDYGCGSGILALAAAKLGAAEVVAIDHDPQALAACRANAAANGVALQVSAPEALPPGPYDLIAANILAGPLHALEPVFATHARSGARIALCGILRQQAADLIGAYAATFALTVERACEEWALVSGCRR